MGIRDIFATSKPAVELTVDAASAPAPFNNAGAYNQYLFTQSTASRSTAMAVPTIARARNIICSTLAGLPLEIYSKVDGSHVATPDVINRPDPRVPGSAIYAWLAEDLLFHGVALISIILTAYTAFATYEDVKTRKAHDEDI